MEKIVKYIKQYAKECVFKVIHNTKIDKDLLFAYIGGAREKIMVYDISCEREIARICYALNNKGVYLSEFVVDSEYQQNGIGKTLFDMVGCRGLQLDKKLIYGVASPTDEIKGVSKEEDDTFEEEKKAIVKIYEKLGCEVISDDEDNHFTFKIEKNAKFNKQTVNFIKEIKQLNESEEDKIK